MALWSLCSRERSNSEVRTGSLRLLGKKRSYLHGDGNTSIREDLGRMNGVSVRLALVPTERGCIVQRKNFN